MTTESVATMLAGGVEVASEAIQMGEDQVEVTSELPTSELPSEDQQ